MNKNILILLGLGAIAYYVWYKNKQKKDSIENIDITKNPSVVNEIVQEATNQQKSKFTNAFLKQYNIKMPPIQASKVVKDAALKMQDERYSNQIKRQLSQPKVYL
jgi:hypothetical protein